MGDTCWSCYTYSSGKYQMITMPNENYSFRPEEAQRSCFGVGNCSKVHFHTFKWPVCFIFYRKLYCHPKFKIIQNLKHLLKSSKNKFPIFHRSSILNGWVYQKLPKNKTVLQLNILKKKCSAKLKTIYCTISQVFNTWPKCVFTW